MRQLWQCPQLLQFTTVALLYTQLQTAKLAPCVQSLDVFCPDL
jgi:hypothetical protein